MLWSRTLPRRAASRALPLLEAPQLALEVPQLLEVLVDAREPQIRDLVHLGEVAKNLESHVLGRNLGAATTEVLLHSVDERGELLLGDRPVRDRLPDARDDLHPVVGLVRARALHDCQSQGFHALHGREAPLARTTLPSPADRGSVVDGPGVDHPVVRLTTPGAPHQPTVNHNM